MMRSLGYRHSLGGRWTVINELILFKTYRSDLVDKFLDYASKGVSTRMHDNMHGRE